MIIIYTADPSPRLKYVLDYLFGLRNYLQWQWSQDFSAVSDSSDTCIAYTEAPIAGCYWIKPCGILNETGIKAHPVSVTESLGRQVIFKNEGEHGFDLFGAVFYCLSRYEEYEAFTPDRHGRFPHQQSFQWKHNCLHLPLVDLWVNDLRQVLQKRYGINIHQELPTVWPTIDIDAAFTYKGRSFPRQVAGFAKSALQGNVYELKKRFSVLSGKSHDPNDNFDYQLQQLRTQGLSANYFIQIGQYGPLDKNIPASNKAFRNIIKSLHKEGHTIGLHPSYASNSRAEIIQSEKKLLEEIIEAPLVCSRQHFLRFRLPETFRVLASIGFKREFSMGYSEVAGFRAGTSRPFLWYDIERETATEMQLIPFSVMDVAYKQFGKMNVAETLAASGKIKDELRVCGGNFTFVFHNESLSGHRGWEGWEAVFESWLKQ